MEKLTKREEEIMQVLWGLKRAMVKDVIAKLPLPESPYNTISSIIRILEKKGFVDHKAYGKTHEYFPIVTRKAYRKFTFKLMMRDYFGGSYPDLMSFMVKDRDMSEHDIKVLKMILDESESDRKQKNVEAEKKKQSKAKGDKD